MTDPLDLSLHDLAAALRAGDLDCRDLTEAALKRQERYAETLGAYKSRDPELARAQAAAAHAAFTARVDLGPLQGLPISVKDLYGVAGFPTFAGTPKRLPPAYEADGPVIAAARRQLGVVVGKTHTVELAFGGVGTNPHWPTPRNPWDAAAHRVPGGSSAGAGVSLIEGSAVLAFGSDTGGSVRIPASATGTVGLKPTYGRWPLAGIFPLSPSLDTPGFMTRSAADAAFAFAALDPLLAAGGGPAPGRPDMAGLKLGVPQDFFWDDCSPGVAEGVRAALAELEAAGARLVPFALPGVVEAYEYIKIGGLAAAEAYSFVQAELPEVFETLDPNVANRMAEAGALPARDYIRRKAGIAALARGAQAALAEIEAVATPTIPIAPPTLDEVAQPEGYRRNNMLMLRNTSIGNLMGLCAMSLPVALCGAGMPVGLQLMAKGGGDARLVALSTAVEGVLGDAPARLGTAPLVKG